MRHEPVRLLDADPATLPGARTPEVVSVEPGGTYRLRVHPVAKRIEDADVAMLAYGGSIPGPALRVRQGSEVLVEVVNETEMSTTVHWHGLRLENRYDGVPHETQQPIEPGASYTHRLTFPDPGLFWYHPHVREDYAQEMGLYGNVLVDPSDPDYWPHADREVVLTLDDVLVEQGAVGPFESHHATFAAMGRFGNVMLTAGEVAPRLEAARGEVVRLYLTNTANTRVFRIRLPGARMKLVGGDGGRVEHEQWVDDVVLAPSERAVVDVSFAEPGVHALRHVTPGQTYELGTFAVTDGTGAAPAFDRLRSNAEMVEERARIAPYLDAPPDKTLSLVAEMDVAAPAGAATTYTCPMHPEVVSSEPGHCPHCGMKLLPAPAGHGGHDAHAHHPSGGPGGDGVEWEDDMVDVNRSTNPSNMRWKLVDRASGKANGDIDWVFDAGDQVKVRIVNEADSDHPMHHPFHVHGQRFLVLARDGVPEPNLVWKDTVLVRKDQVVDVLIDASNPGLWMAHCHIPEHMESGMMFDFRVRSRG